MKNNQNRLTFSGHLKELKKRVVISCLLFILFFVAGMIFCNNILGFTLILGRNAGYEFIYTSPQEIIIQNIKVAGILSLLFSFPVILYEFSTFISPIFNTRFIIIKMLFVEIIGIGLFIIGGLFSYHILLPFSFQYLYAMGESINVKAQISVEQYISFLTTIFICIGLIFEIPLVSVILAKFKIINAKIMKSARPFIIIIIFVISAIITPPDVISQIMVATPMVLLYQLSIILCSFIEKGRFFIYGKSSKNK